jgi:hypothetical protein
MRGTIPPLLQYAFMAWCLVKHRESFTFTFYNSTCCFYECETWPVRVRGELRLRRLRTGCRGEYLELRGRKWQDTGDITVIKLRVMRREVNRACMPEMENSYIILVGKPEGKRQYFEQLGAGGRILLELILEKWDEKAWTGIICLWIRLSGGFLWKR